tara:strand:- start:1294 stop:1809 length:516 start_codon:yes stop_codon:yes gene_type:complete
MSFASLKGRGVDTRLDGTLAYIQKMHISINEHLNKLDSSLDVIEERFGHAQGAFNSLNRDVKALESKPDPVIPVVPSLQPIRADVAKLYVLVAALNEEMVKSHVSLNDEMIRSRNALQAVQDKYEQADSKIMARIDAIKIPVIPKIPSLRNTYMWLTALTVLNLVILYVKL